MICDICNMVGDHNHRCPNYVPPKANRYCSACGDGIYDGEEYIVNDDNECRHYDCFYGVGGLLEWLGYEIKTMEEFG